MDGQKILPSRFSLFTFILALAIPLALLCFGTRRARAEIVAPGETTNITNAPLTPQVAGPVLTETKPVIKTPDPAPSKAEPAADTPKADTTKADATKPETTEKPVTSEIEHTPIRKLTAPKDANTAAASAPTPATTSVLPAGISQVLQVAAALAIVLGLIFIGKAAAKKFLPQAKTSNGKNVIEILARHPLSKNQSLVLVRIGSQIVTLNQGKDSSQSVLVISDPTEVAKIIGQIDGQSPNSIQSGFNRLLANARMDLEDPANDPDREELNLREIEPDALDSQLEEMAAAKRQLMELRQQVRSVRDSLTHD